MGIKQLLEADIKAALLSGDKQRVTILRTIKSVILESEIAQGKREEGLEEQELIALFFKEAKKRQDAANMYNNAGETERANREEAEKLIIINYLPKQLTNTELEKLVNDAMSEVEGPHGPHTMGKIIAMVRDKAQGKADGARITMAVKERIFQ